MQLFMHIYYYNFERIYCQDDFRSEKNERFSYKQKINGVTSACFCLIIFGVILFLSHLLSRNNSHAKPNIMEHVTTISSIMTPYKSGIFTAVHELPDN